MRSVLIDDKFPEFSFSKIRFLIGFHLLSLWPFAVSFPNGGSTKSHICPEIVTKRLVQIPQKNTFIIFL